MTSPNTTRIEPLARPLDGVAAVPGDKSISHRAVMFASMAEGTFATHRVLNSADVRSTIAAIVRFGATVALERQSMVLLQVVLLAGGQMAQRSQRNLLIVVIQVQRLVC